MANETACGLCMCGGIQTTCTCGGYTDYVCVCVVGEGHRLLVYYLLIIICIIQFKGHFKCVFVQ
jgi:hypothetical protein